MAVGNVIKSIQDIMRQDTGVDGDAQRISQLVWMIFLKIFDDKEEEYESRDDNYKSPLPEKLRWRNWASDDEGITGDDLLKFINNELFETLKKLNPADPRGLIVKAVFEDAYNYMKSGTLIRQVINKINEIDFNSSEDRHLFNDIYEKVLRDLQSAGNAGEYYTPRPVTKFMVERVKPRLAEKVLDVACGTGGFLVNAIEYIRRNEVKSVDDRRTLEQNIIGYEKKPLPHLLCVTNMLLHGIEVPKEIHRDNLLARPMTTGFTKEDRVEVIITNPPFGGVEESGIEQNFPTAFRTKETADLFLLLMTHLLKDNGRGAVVLPDGSMFGEGGVKTRVKEKLLQECNLHTIVRLPNGVFSPYTAIKTNLLFFTKGEPTNEIWYYELPLPEGKKNYSKTTPIKDDDFDACIAWWDSREVNKRAWKYDFRSAYNKAVEEATPFWNASKEAEEKARQFERDEREAADAIKRLQQSLLNNGASNKEHAKIKKQIKNLMEQRRQLSEVVRQEREAAREARVKGDSIYDPIYNFDIKNPNNVAGVEDLSPQQIAEDILNKEHRITELMSEIIQVLSR